jgi:hypothetical protein
MSSVNVVWDMKDNLLVAEFVVLSRPEPENGYSGLCNHLKLSPKRRSEKILKKYF